MVTPRSSRTVILTRIAVAALVSVLVVVLLVRTFPDQFDRVSRSAWDLAQRADPYGAEEGPVQIIDIDDSSLPRVGGRPWSRQVMAELLEDLREAGAAVVGFDLKFAGPSADEATILGAEIDHHFADVIGKLPVVIGFMMDESGENGPVVQKGAIAFTRTATTPPLPRFSAAIVDAPELEAAAQGVGYANVRVDLDGRIRQIPLFALLHGKIVPSFAAEMVRVAQGAYAYVGTGGSYGLDRVLIGKVPVSTDAGGQVWLHYAHTRPDRFIHAADVLAGTFDRARISGKMVLVGVSAPIFGDRWPSPLGSEMPGVEILAQLVEQILHGDLLSRPLWARGAELLFVVIAALAVTLSASFGRRPLFAASGVLIVSAVVWVGWAFAQWHILVDPIMPLFGIAIATCGGFLIVAPKRSARGA